MKHAKTHIKRLMNKPAVFSKRSLKGTLAVGILALSLTLGATSSLALSLNDKAELKSNFLHLGDVFPDVEKHADFVLGPAPEPGATMVLDANSLNQIAASFGLPWKTYNQFESLIVTRAATVVSADDITVAITDHLKNNEFMRDFSVDLSNKNTQIILSDDYSSAIEIGAFEYDDRRHFFTAEIITQDGESTSVNGRVTKMTEVPVLTDKKRNGEIITANDIEWVSIEEKFLNPNMIIDAAQLIGMTPRRYVTGDTPIRVSDMMSPVIVKKGDVVTMAMDTGKIQLVAKGRALDNGAMGDTIRVVNRSSNKIVEAHVNGAQSVTVTPGIQAAF